MRQCHYKHPRFPDGRCPRPALKGWTTCSSHRSAGINVTQWFRMQALRIMKEKADA